MNALFTRLKQDPHKISIKKQVSAFPGKHFSPHLIENRDSTKFKQVLYEKLLTASL